MASSAETIIFSIAIKHSEGFDIKEFEFREHSKVVIGRYGKNEIVLEHPGISNKHLEIVFDLQSETRLAVRDMSSNGTGLQMPGSYVTQKLAKDQLTPIPDRVVVLLPMIVKAKGGVEQRRTVSVHLGTEKPSFDELEQLHAPPPTVAEPDGGVLQQHVQDLDERLNERVIEREAAFRQEELRAQQIDEQLEEQRAQREAELEEERLEHRRREEAERREREEAERRDREAAADREHEEAEAMLRAAAERFSQEEPEVSKRSRKDGSRQGQGEKKKRKRSNREGSAVQEEQDAQEALKLARRERQEREEREELERIAREAEEDAQREAVNQARLDQEQADGDREKESGRGKKKDRDRADREDRKRRKRGDEHRDVDERKERKQREREETERKQLESREREETERKEREAREHEAREREEQEARLRQELEATEQQEQEQKLRELDQLEKELDREDLEPVALNRIQQCLGEDLEADTVADQNALSQARLRELEEEDRQAWERAERERQLRTGNWDKRMEQQGAVEQDELLDDSQRAASRSASVESKPNAVQQAQPQEGAAASPHGSSKRGLPSWVVLEAKALYFSESQRKFFPVYISKIDDREKLVFCVFEENSQVWKSISFTFFASPRCPLRPRSSAQREAAKRARNSSRSRSATPEWWQMKEKKSVEQLIEEQELEARMNAEREAREQERLREEKRRRDIMEAEKRKVEEAFEQRRKEHEAQELQREEEWRQQLREKRLQEAAQDQAERDASEEVREERRKKKRKEKEKRDEEDRRKRKEEEAKERKTQEQEDAFAEAIMSAERKKKVKEQEKAAREADEYMMGQPSQYDPRTVANGQWNQYSAQASGSPTGAWSAQASGPGAWPSQGYDRSGPWNAGQAANAWPSKGNGWQGSAGTSSQIPAAFRGKAVGSIPSAMPGAASKGGGMPPGTAVAGKGYGKPPQPVYPPQRPVDPIRAPAPIVRPAGYGAGGPPGYPSARGNVNVAAQWQQQQQWRPSWPAAGAPMQARGMAVKGGPR